MTQDRHLSGGVCHVITALPVGGAQTILASVVRGLSDEFPMDVVSLTDTGDVGRQLQQANVRVTALGMVPGVPDPAGLFRLVQYLRGRAPKVVQTWMYHSDLLGGLASHLAHRVPCIWNVRNVDLSAAHVKWQTRWVAKLCARLSHRLPRRIICNSHVAARAHAQIGYAADKLIVVPNGIDVERFRPYPAARETLRAELGIQSDAFIVGLVGRLHPHKDHQSFVEAAGMLNNRLHGSAHFVLCGENVEPTNPELAGWVKDAGLGNAVHLLGVRTDIEQVTAAFDVAVSSSVGESFSNSVGEAMACGVPCVATDVGDSALIVADAGRTVRPRSPSALAAAVQELRLLSAKQRHELGTRARNRIVTNYSLDSMLRKYAELYAAVSTDGESAMALPENPLGTNERIAS